MKRYYYKRDQKIEVDELEAVVAVKVVASDSRSRNDAVRALGDSAESVVAKHVGDNPDESIEAFTKANWVFIKANEKTAELLSRSEEPEKSESSGVVIKRKDGTIAVATRRLNVQLLASLSEAEAEQVLAEQQLTVVNKLKFAPNLYEVIASAHADALAASEQLRDDTRFVFAEPALIVHLPGRALPMMVWEDAAVQRATPSDPDLNDQWQWSNDGSGGGVAGADVSAEAAWDHTFGAGMRVAVIDNGFDVGHEDLAAGVLPDSAFYAAGGVFTLGTAGMPDSSHGTFCAGMVGARRENGVGGVGAAPDCGLMLIACLTDQVGTQTTLARSVAYAIDPSTENPGANPNDAADILVCSLGPSNGAVWELESVLELALDGAPNGRQGMGLPIFWAASNGNNVDVLQDEVVSHPNVIAVVRSNRSDLEDNAARGETVELIAPGVDVYSTTSGDAYTTNTGTSFAAPCAAGCAALALSVNPSLSGAELREVMRASADKIGGVVYDAAGHNDDYGFGRVNADAAVRLAALRVTLQTANVVFNDIPEGELTARAVEWECFGLEDINFEVVSGPSGPFALLLGSTVTVPAPGVGSGAKAQLWLSYTGTSAGDSASGSITVRCVETGEQWVVGISANTIARPTVAVALVLDKSGSMRADAGDGRTRVQVLREAAEIFVGVSKPETGIGIVAFDHDAQVVMPITDAGAETFGAGRVAATAAIAAHTPNPSGTTSIGDGAELAGTLLDSVSGSYDTTAMIVLTDGQENATKLIADVSGSIDDTVFAIGLGQPSSINPAKLGELTNGSDGYVVVTGDISSDEYFTLSKYYLQILAGVSNEEVVLDPQGQLRAGDEVEIPFYLTREDAGCDVIMLCPAPHVMQFELISPTGQVIQAGSLPAGVQRIAGRGVTYYRFNLPVVDANGKASATGRWLVRLRCDRGQFKEYLQKLEGSDIAAFEYAAKHGLRYAVEVHAQTSIRFDAQLNQKSIKPGSKFELRARVQELGLPLVGRASVVAEVTGPQGAFTVKLKETATGEFGATVQAEKRGVYSCRVVASGKTLRGERFTRERRLSASVYVPGSVYQAGEPGKGGDEPGNPGDRPGKGEGCLDEKCRKQVRVLQQAIEEHDFISSPLKEILARKGYRLEDVLRCLRDATQQSRPQLIDIGGNLKLDWSDVIDAFDLINTPTLNTDLTIIPKEPVKTDTRSEAMKIAQMIRAIG